LAGELEPEEPPEEPDEPPEDEPEDDAPDDPDKLEEPDELLLSALAALE